MYITCEITQPFNLNVFIAVFLQNRPRRKVLKREHLIDQTNYWKQREWEVT